MAIPNFQQEQDIECVEWDWCDEEIEMKEDFKQYLENIKDIYDDISPHIIHSYVTAIKFIKML